MRLINRLAGRLLRRMQSRNSEQSAQMPRAERVNPVQADPHDAFQEGVRYFTNKQYEEAVESLEGWLNAEHEDPDAYYCLGLALFHLSRHEEAADAFSMALCFSPDMVKAHLGLAHAESAQGKVDEALSTLEKALAFGAGAAAHNLKGSLLLAKGDIAGAVACFESAVAREPENCLAHSNLGYVLFRELGEYERGARQIERAIELDRNNDDAQCNYSMVLSHYGDYEQALAVCDRLLTSRPQMHEARLNRALVLLLLGRFEQAWDDYEARKLVRSNYILRRFPCPEWHGEDLSGKTILVHGEQGLGDEIMFASCFKELMARAGHCLIECEARLEQLFKRSFAGARIVVGEQSGNVPGWWSNEPRIDFHVGSGSLPRRFRRSSTAFPQHSGYLHAESGRVEYWRARLRRLGPGLNVGISWRGGARSTRRGLRSIDLCEWMPLLNTQNAQFVSLQYGEVSAECERFEAEHGIALNHWHEAIIDLDETAALIAGLDLVISVCTAVIHLSGALGRPVWVLVPSSPEWRYQAAGESMPWYPSAKLFRQRVAGDWGEVIEEAAEKLRALSLRDVPGAIDDNCHAS